MLPHSLAPPVFQRCGREQCVWTTSGMLCASQNGLISHPTPSSSKTLLARTPLRHNVEISRYHPQPSPSTSISISNLFFSLDIIPDNGSVLSIGLNGDRLKCKVDGLFCYRTKGSDVFRRLKRQRH
ncbi:hypothetical protein AMTR_s00003p00159820 [Amborella trichopoda]|uniref:Uncharacterized protein n=1 Tax=Amborella trichopoda TaxID=13333 RepID=W1P6L0_AMBTC|nr:hypothetical protein AMTR_s00003p00159820 [Amborella trichopoda]